MFAAKEAEERRLRSAVAVNPSLAGRFGPAWDEMAAIQRKRIQQNRAASAIVSISNFAGSGLLDYAVTLVQAASERAKPNAERLPQFTDQALVEVEQQLEHTAPIYAEVSRNSSSVLRLRSCNAIPVPTILSFASC